MPLSRNQDAAPVEHERPRREDGIGVATPGVLECLLHVLRVDDPALQPFPKPPGPQDVPSGDAVWGVHRVGDGDVLNVRLVQVFKLADTPGPGPEADPAQCVHPHGGRNEMAGVGKIVDKLLVSRQISIIGGSTLNLPGKHAARSEGETQAHTHNLLSRLAEGIP